MPIIQAKNGILVKSSDLFYTCRKYLKKGKNFLNNCTYIKTLNLNSSAVIELNRLYQHLLYCSLIVGTFYKIKTYIGNKMT